MWTNVIFKLDLIFSIILIATISSTNVPQDCCLVFVCLFKLCAPYSFSCSDYFFSPQLRCHCNSVFGHVSLNKDAHGLEEKKTALKSDDSKEAKESHPLISGQRFGQCG